MGTTLVTQAGGNSDIQEYSKTIVYNAGNSNQVAQEVKTLLHISGARGLVYDAAGGALTNGSTGAKNVIDFEGVLRTTKSLEIRYANARRIENAIQYSENFAHANWKKSNPGTGTLPIVTPNYGLDIYNNQAACRVILDTTSGTINADQSTFYYDVTSTQAVCTYLKLNTGTTATILLIGPGNSQTITITDEWKRFYLPALSVASLKLILRLVGDGSTSKYADLLVCFPSAEIKSGSYNICVDEYINGNQVYNAGAVGVKYSNTYNKHTYDPTTLQVEERMLYKYGLAVGDSLGDGAGEFPALLTDNAIQTLVNQCVASARIYSWDNSITLRLEAHISDYPYDIVILEGGVNDINGLIALNLMQGQMQTNVATVRNNAPNAEILILNVGPWHASVNWTEGKQAQTIAWNSWLADYCMSENIKLVDIYQALGDSSDPTATLPAWTIDGLHPNGDGSIVIRNAIYEQMLLSEDKPVPIIPALLHEPATTNLALLPRDLTNAAWVKVGCTAAKTATGTDGVANSASTLTATAANATCLQTVTSASANRVTGAFVKRKTGTGVIEMTQDNGTTWTPVTVPAEWGAEPLVIPAATLTDPVFGFRIVTSGDAIDVDWVQHELGSHITSPISGSRTIDSHRVPLVANVNFPQTKGIAFGKLTMEFASSTTAKSLICTNTGTDFIYDDGTGKIAITDGTNTATVDVGGWAAGDTILFTAPWVTDTMSIHASKNGGAWADSANTTYDGTFPVGANLLLCNASTDSILINSIKIKSTTKSLADAQAWAKAAAIYEAI